MIRVSLFVGLLFFCNGCVQAQSCSDLSSLIDKTYGFKPSKLTGQQITAKSSELDKVWDFVGKDVGGMLPCLRGEIQKRKSDTFFRFNASNLLFKHDQSTETKLLLIETYSEADLADINTRYWLPYIAQFGNEGLDVSKAGETWLKFPDPSYHLPQHGTRPVTKATGALAIYGSMDESIATPALVKLASSEDAELQSNAIWLLLYLSTQESDAALADISERLPKPVSEGIKSGIASRKLVEPRAGEPKLSRETIVKAMEELVAGSPDAWIKLTVDVPDGERDVVTVLSESDLPLVRKVRRTYAANPTPHMPEWYSAFTEVINTLRRSSSRTAVSK